MDVEKIARAYERIVEEVEKVFVGQSDLVEGVLVALFAEGNVLIEGVQFWRSWPYLRPLWSPMHRMDCISYCRSH